MNQTFLRWVAVLFAFVWTWVIFAFVFGEPNPFTWNAMGRLIYLVLGTDWAITTYNYTRLKE